MKPRIDPIDQNLERRTITDEKVRVAEMALWPKEAPTRNSSRLLVVALMALAAAACAETRPYHTLTSEPAPRVGKLVLPVAIDIDGPNVRWRCTYDVADTGQQFTVEQSAPFCYYHRVTP